jgi:molybdate transport system ATP-binding protein
MTLSATIRTRLSDAFTLDVFLSAPAGVTILFGASGSGKSTVLRAVAGLLTPDAGSITIGSRVVFDASDARNVPARARRIGYVFQDLALFPHLSVEDNLAFGLAGLPADVIRHKVREIATSFKIDHLLGRRPSAISGGERQRTALARSLVTDPAALLLDEPLSALDHATQSRIIDDLRRWNTAHDIPILYVTHSHREVFALGDRVIVLEHGRVAATGTPHDVLEMPEQASLAQLAGFENVLDAEVITRKANAGTMTCRLRDSDVELEVPLAPGAAGSTVQIAIRAGDILLAIEPPRGISARNVLRGQLASLTRDGAAMVAAVDTGRRFVVHLTPSSADALGLTPGQDVWLVIKTYSCRIAA